MTDVYTMTDEDKRLLRVALNTAALGADHSARARLVTLLLTGEVTVTEMGPGREAHDFSRGRQSPVRAIGPKLSNPSAMI